MTELAFIIHVSQLTMTISVKRSLKEVLGQSTDSDDLRCCYTVLFFVQLVSQRHCETTCDSCRVYKTQLKARMPFTKCRVPVVCKNNFSVHFSGAGFVTEIILPNKQNIAYSLGINEIDGVTKLTFNYMQLLHRPLWPRYLQNRRDRMI